MWSYLSSWLLAAESDERDPSLLVCSPRVLDTGEDSEDAEWLWVDCIAMDSDDVSGLTSQYVVIPPVTRPESTPEPACHLLDGPTLTQLKRKQPHKKRPKRGKKYPFKMFTQPKVEVVRTPATHYRRKRKFAPPRFSKITKAVRKVESPKNKTLDIAIGLPPACQVSQNSVCDTVVSFCHAMPLAYNNSRQATINAMIPPAGAPRLNNSLLPTSQTVQLWSINNDVIERVSCDLVNLMTASEVQEIRFMLGNHMKAQQLTYEGPFHGLPNNQPLAICAPPIVRNRSQEKFGLTTKPGLLCLVRYKTSRKNRVWRRSRVGQASPCPRPRPRLGQAALTPRAQPLAIACRSADVLLTLRVYLTHVLKILVCKYEALVDQADTTELTCKSRKKQTPLQICRAGNQVKFNALKNKTHKANSKKTLQRTTHVQHRRPIRGNRKRAMSCRRFRSAGQRAC